MLNASPPQRLERTAQTSTSTANAPYYAAFLALSAEQRRVLLKRVEIVDGAAPAADIQPLLERAVRKSVKPQRRAPLVDRLRGWWHKRAIAHLDAIATGQRDRITSAELESELLELADALRDENLPIDVLDMVEPTDQEVSESDRIFVAQLRLVALGSERLRKCIYDHNRAFAQRSRWQRDRLLEIGELSRYDRELKEAWERFFLPLTDNDGSEDNVDEETIRREARERFAELDRSDLAPIRREVRGGVGGPWFPARHCRPAGDRLASAVARSPARSSGRGPRRSARRGGGMTSATRLNTCPVRGTRAVQSGVPGVDVALCRRAARETLSRPRDAVGLESSHRAARVARSAPGAHCPSRSDRRWANGSGYPHPEAILGLGSRARPCGRWYRTAYGWGSSMAW